MLQNFLKYLLFLSLLVTSVGCDNQFHPLPSENVVFKLTATINGQVKTWEAGVDNQYMYTYTSKDSNDLTLFQGTLGEVGCQFCPNSISFDFAQASHSNLIDDLFNNSQAIHFRNNSIPQVISGYDVVFEAKLFGTPPYTFDWDFGDTTGIIHSTNPLILHHYSYAGIYNVCVQITDATGTQTHFCKEISTDNSMTCSGSFRVFPIGNNFPNSYLLQTYPAGVPPFNYQWHIAYDTVSTFNHVVQSPIVTVNQFSEVSVNLAITDDNDCSCSLSQDIVFHNADSLYTNFFEYASSPNVIAGLAQDYFSTLNIQYIDDNGKSYTSALHEQPNTTYLNILEVTDYFPNEDGARTKRVTLEFGCRLFNPDGSYVDIKDGLGIIGIAY